MSKSDILAEENIIPTLENLIETANTHLEYLKDLTQHLPEGVIDRQIKTAEASLKYYQALQADWVKYFKAEKAKEHFKAKTVAVKESLAAKKVAKKKAKK